MTVLDDKVKTLESYVAGFDNHKLERHIGCPVTVSVLRKSKSYDFGISFLEIMKLGFAIIKTSTCNGREEVVLKLLTE